MQELPKAERFLKQIVIRKAQQYINKSEDIANEFMKQRQEAENNSFKSYQYLEQLQRQVRILKAVQMTGVEVHGSSMEDVKVLIEKYEGMIQTYHKELRPRKTQQKMTEERLNQEHQNEQKEMSQMDSSFNGSHASFQTQDYLQPNQRQAFLNVGPVQKQIKNPQNLRKNLIVWSLKSLEFIVMILMSLSLVKIIFFI